MSVSINVGLLSVGVLIIRALLVGVYTISCGVQDPVKRPYVTCECPGIWDAYNINRPLYTTSERIRC